MAHFYNFLLVASPKNKLFGLATLFAQQTWFYWKSSSASTISDGNFASEVKPWEVFLMERSPNFTYLTVE